MSRCHRFSQHTKCPTGYNDWHQWASVKIRTHTQKRCETCGLYVIWVPRGADDQIPEQEIGTS